MTIPGGYAPLGVDDILHSIDAAAEQEQMAAQIRQRKEQCIARVQNMFRKKVNEFGPAQWAMVQAFENQQTAGTTPTKKGNAFDPRLGQATGSFRMAGRR